MSACSSQEKENERTNEKKLFSNTIFCPLNTYTSYISWLTINKKHIAVSNYVYYTIQIAWCILTHFKLQAPLYFACFLVCSTWPFQQPQKYQWIHLLEELWGKSKNGTVLLLKIPSLKSTSGPIIGIFMEKIWMKLEKIARAKNISPVWCDERWSWRLRRSKQFLLPMNMCNKFVAHTNQINTQLI